MEIGQTNYDRDIHESCRTLSIPRSIKGSGVAKDNAGEPSQAMQAKQEVQTNGHIRG